MKTNKGSNFKIDQLYPVHKPPSIMGESDRDVWFNLTVMEFLDLLGVPMTAASCLTKTGKLLHIFNLMGFHEELRNHSISWKSIKKRGYPPRAAAELILKSILRKNPGFLEINKKNNSEIIEKNNQIKETSLNRLPPSPQKDPEYSNPDLKANPGILEIFKRIKKIRNKKKIIAGSKPQLSKLDIIGKLPKNEKD